MWLSLWGGGRAHWVQVCRLSRLQDLPECLRWSSVVCSVVFPLCPRCIACKYGSISHFKGVFRGFWGCCVGLCCLRALRGLWGFCTRVELGGLKTCGVFASVFLSFSLCLPFVFPCSSSGCPALLWLSFFLCLSSCLVFPFLLCLCCFFFPYGLYAKERAQGFAPCVLDCLVVGCFIWLLLCTLRTRPGSIR